MAKQEHEWFRPDWLKSEWECCKICGIVRRMDGIANKPCRGPVSVGPREASPTDGKSSGE